MSDSMIDIQFINTIEKITSSLKLITSLDEVGFATLNGCRNVLGAYYPEVIVGLMVDVEHHKLIFASLIQALINLKIMNFSPKTQEIPAPSRTGSRLINYLNTRRGGAKPMFLTLSNQLQSTACSDYVCVCRNAITRWIDTPVDAIAIRQDFEFGIVKILTIWFDNWKNKASQLNDPIYQRIPSEQLERIRMYVMNKYENGMISYLDKLRKRKGAPAELVNYVQARVDEINAEKEAERQRLAMPEQRLGPEDIDRHSEDEEEEEIPPVRGDALGPDDLQDSHVDHPHPKVKRSVDPLNLFMTSRSYDDV